MRATAPPVLWGASPEPVPVRLPHVHAATACCCRHSCHSCYVRLSDLQLWLHPSCCATVRPLQPHPRPASYITRLADFVDLYSQGLEVDQLEERLGVHTHCGHSQAARECAGLEGLHLMAVIEGANPPQPLTSCGWGGTGCNLYDQYTAHALGPRCEPAAVQACVSLLAPPHRPPPCMPCAVVTYYCGRAVAGSDRSSWVAGQDADVLGVGDLIALLRMLRNASPAARARALDALVGLQAQLQAAVRVLQGKPSVYSPVSAAAAGGAAQREAAAGAEGEQQQLEDACGEEQAYDAATAEEEEAAADEKEAGHQAGAQQLRWDGRQLPQLVLRCHMDGDNVVSGGGAHCSLCWNLLCGAACWVLGTTMFCHRAWDVVCCSPHVVVPIVGHGFHTRPQL